MGGWIGQLINNPIATVNKTADEIIRDPLPTLVTVGLVSVGVPPVLAGAAGGATSAAEHGTDIVTGAVTGAAMGYVGGEVAGSAAGAGYEPIYSGAAGGAAAGATGAVLSGGDIGKGILTGGITGGISGGVGMTQPTSTGELAPVYDATGVAPGQVYQPAQLVVPANIPLPNWASGSKDVVVKASDGTIGVQNPEGYTISYDGTTMLGRPESPFVGGGTPESQIVSQTTQPVNPTEIPTELPPEQTTTIAGTDVPKYVEPTVGPSVQVASTDNTLPVTESVKPTEPTPTVEEPVQDMGEITITAPKEPIVTETPLTPITPVVIPPTRPVTELQATDIYPPSTEPLTPVTPVVIPPTPPVTELQATDTNPPSTEPTTPTEIPELIDNKPVVQPVPIVPVTTPTTTPSENVDTTTGHYTWGTPYPLHLAEGLNPGLIKPPTFYKNVNPAQSQYYWGSHPFQPGPTFNEQLYNTVPNAPATPWGATHAQTSATAQDILNAMYGQYPLLNTTNVNGPVIPQ